MAGCLGCKAVQVGARRVPELPGIVLGARGVSGHARVIAKRTRGNGFRGGLSACGVG